MRVRVSLRELRQPKPWEYGIRFLFGGLVTAGSGLLAQRFGPEVGGLFLGFPAILPATLTLMQRHGGRRKAIDEGRGATLGSVALVAFASVVWGMSTTWAAPLVLVVATVAWLIVSLALWWWVLAER